MPPKVASLSLNSSHLIALLVDDGLAIWDLSAPEDAESAKGRQGAARATLLSFPNAH